MKLTPENEAIVDKCREALATFHQYDDFALMIQNATAQKCTEIAENWPGGSLIRNKLREAFGLAPENEPERKI